MRQSLIEDMQVRNYSPLHQAERRAAEISTGPGVERAPIRDGGSSQAARGSGGARQRRRAEAGARGSSAVVAVAAAVVAAARQM